MNDTSTKHKSRTAINKFKQISTTVFIVIVTGGLIASVLTLNSVIQQMYVVSSPVTGTNTTTINQITIDQATLNSLNQLKTSGENSSNQTLPSGRINPFSG